MRSSILLAIFLVSIACGYFLSSSIGRPALRDELEGQLSRLLRQPVDVESARFRVSWQGGLQLESSRLSTFPDDDGSQLFVQRAVARLNAPALLTGRIRLRELLLEGARLRIERNAGGEWSPEPIAQLADRPADGAAPGLDQRVRTLHAFEGTARFLLEKGLLANRLELRDSQILLEDAAVRDAADPHRLQLSRINATLTRSWLSGETELSLRSSLIDEQGRQTVIEAEGRRDSEGAIHLSLAAHDLELDSVEAHLRRLLPDLELSGRLAGVLSIDTPLPEHGRIEIDWVLSDLAGSIEFDGERVPGEIARLGLRSRLELHPARLRLDRAEFSSGAVRLDVSGSAERPLHDASQVSFSARVRGVGLDELQRFIDTLPPADRDAIGRLLERVTSGEIESLGARGTTSVAQWRRLLGGELQRLPEQLTLGVEVEDVVLGAAGSDQITGLGARVEWRGDRIDVRRATALWNGEPLPILDASIDGVSHLFTGAPSDRVVRQGAERLPGLRTLWESFSGEREARQGGTSPPGVRIVVDELHHPALRWPLRHAHLDLQATHTGMRVLIEEGQWAGAPIRGEGIWARVPKPHLILELRASAPGELQTSLESDAPESEAQESEKSHPWLRGSFEVDPVETIVLPYSQFGGEFEVRGNELELRALRGSLIPTGRFVASGTVDLTDADELPLDFQFEVLDGHLASLTEAVRFPPDFAHGRARVAGSLTGPIGRGRALLSRLDGRIEVTATQGEVLRSLPVVTAVAGLSDGLVTHDTVRFERIETTLKVEDGVLSTKRFALDGPMRLLAEGRFDPFAREESIDIVVGIFLMRQLDQVLDRLPLIKHLTDSDKGLFGVYFKLTGTWNEPKVETLELQTLAEGNILSQVMQAPMRMFRELGSFFGLEEREVEVAPEQP